jgi:hypothetical protein
MGEAAVMKTRAVLTLPLALVVAFLAASLTPQGVDAAPSVKRVVAAERYAHELLNCTRTGGFVRVDGKCVKRAGNRHSAWRKPLRLHANISRKVAWPWARAMADRGFCAHSFASLPDLTQRMRTSGFHYRFHGENIGCGSSVGSPKQVVLAVHRMMQAEKRWRGGHWRNIKQTGYKSVGIAVARGNGRTTVVWDFYGKRY